MGRNGFPLLKCSISVESFQQGVLWECNQLELIGVRTYVTMDHSKMMTCPQVSYYVDSPSGEMTRDESFDIANEVRQSFAVEERLFSLSRRR